MQIILCNKILYRIIIGKEFKHHVAIDKSKYLNNIDESFGFICIHISIELIFPIDGLKTPREVIMNLKYLFGKKYEFQRCILENDLIALHPRIFETIQQFFTKFKFLALQCRQCRIERKDEQHVLSTLNKLGSEYSLFVSIFHSRRASIPNWNIPSLDSFSKSLIQEKEKLVQMGVIETSKNQALLVIDST